MDKVSFITTDSFQLIGLWHIPAEPTQKAVVLAHGITVDKDEGGIFPDLAKALTQAGYAVFRFDFRGSGESQGEQTDLTITGEVEDLEAAINYVKNQGYLQIGLVGASFGGSIATLLTSQRPGLVKALNLWNPVLNYDHTFLHPTLPWLKDVMDQIKKDLAEKGWSELGKRKFHVSKTLFEEMDRLEPFNALSNIDIPTMIIHGDADTKVSYHDSKAYVDLVKGLHELVTVKGSEHGFRATPEYTEQVIQETVAFFRKYL